MGGQEGGTWRILRVPDQRLGGMVITDVMDDLILPQGRYPESFVLISLLEECQEWGVKKGGTWRMLRISD